uniref:Major facilitator superfamily (MFS) profile domain-containing protein n=1 Tax=Quercus lobata TaxID=97700 RepID=A0A7N2MZI5_QUELO
MDRATGIVMDKVGHVIDFYRITRASPYLLLLALSANVTSLFEAFLVGTISQSLQSVRNDFQFVSAELLITMATLAAIVGSMIGDLINDNMGRKTGLLVVNFIFIIGVLFMAFAPTSSTFVIGRTIIGLGVGMASMSNLFYISEASPNRIQGMLISFRGFMSFIGNFISSHCNVFTVNKLADASDALSKSFPPSEVGEELEKIRLAIERTNVMEKNVFKQIWNARKDNVVKKKIVATVIIQFVQQSIGLKTMTYCKSNLQYSKSLVTAEQLYSSSHCP